MTTRTDDWETVWAEYDARAGAPRWQAHTPWYMDPSYVLAQEPTPEEGGGRGRPFMVLASMTIVFMVFMLNIRFVPEAPLLAPSPWQPVEAPVALVSFGAPAEASPSTPRRAAPSDFGALLDLPPPGWVRAEPTAPLPTVALDTALLQFAAPGHQAVAGNETKLPQAGAPGSHRRQTALRGSARPRSAQALLRREQPVARRAEQLAATLPMPDQLCAPAPRPQAEAGTPRRRAAAQASPGGTQAAASTATRGPHPRGVAAASVGHDGPSRLANMAAAGAPRAPPARS